MSGNLENFFKQARQTGKLSLPGRSLSQIPPDIFKLSTLTFGEKWWELVELQYLDLSRNSIRDFPAVNMKESLPEIKVIDLSYNQITSVPNEMFADTLNKVNLSFNKLDNLPDDIGSAVNIAEFLLNNNKLQSVPRSIGVLTAITTLNLSFNTISVLGEEIGNLRNLRQLVLNNNKLSTLPQSLGNLDKLTNLEVHCNVLTNIPPSIAKLKLVRLDLHENRLSSLPDLLPPTLVELYLGFNQFASIPNGVLNCTQLALLDIRDNKLSEVPPNITNLNVLKRLDLTNNNLMTLPGELGMLSKLDALNVEGNSLKSINRAIISKGSKALLAYLKGKLEPEKAEPSTAKGKVGSISGIGSVESAYREGKSKKSVDLSEKKLTDIPADLYAECEILERCKINKNLLSQIPDQFGVTYARTLLVLDISDNKLSSFPPSFNSLSVLQELYVKNNQFNALPEAVAYMKQIKILDFRGNRITALNGAYMKNWVALQDLILNQNMITTLPEEIFRLPDIKHLDLGNNKLSEIPKEITQLKTVQSIDLSNNNLKDLPPEMGLMSQLRALEINGNLIKSIRSNVIAKGTLAILEALKLKIAQ